MTPPTTPSTLSHTVPFTSKLSEQLSQRRDLGETESHIHSDGKSHTLGPPLRPSPKGRSLSDAPKPAPPTPSGADNRPSSKDDASLAPTPETPQRPSSSLHHHDPHTNRHLKSTAPTALSSRTPLSPKLDSSHIYGSPSSVLPRRSRGLDFSRACTNLHHSTLAESSPDSSPTIGGRGVQIPSRRGSLGSTSGPPLSTSGLADRNTNISSSVSSVNMMESDTSSSEEDDEPMVGDKDDVMITNTPQASKMSNGLSPFAVGGMSSPGNDWMGNHHSNAASSLLSFQRARFRSKGRSRHSSSSASGNSSKPSPGPLSPPVMKSVENPNGGGYFGGRPGVGPRRESLSMGTRDLRLSDLSDDGENRTSSSEGRPFGVIRRAVTRRGSLLPKTKTFARIRAALMEETAPIDSDAKREAEVIRQVRESDAPMPQNSPGSTGFSSLDYFTSGASAPSGEDTPAKQPIPAPDEPSFSEQAHRHSGGPEFWDNFDERYRTPPPAPRPPGASGFEDDLAMDMTPSTTIGSSTAEPSKPSERPSSRGSMSQPAAPPSAALAEIKRKRRREDEFDPNLFKRRAVSPSMSSQSSPVMPNSPAVKDNGHHNNNMWGPPPKSNLGSLFPDRGGPPNDNGSGNRNSTAPQTGTLKRVGLQGMNEANDSLMNMSIE